MTEKSRSVTLKQHEGLDFLVTLALEPYVIKLRSAFGTAHSSTTTRTNVLFTLTLALPNGTATGYGEVGMPPKKPYCYLADFDSVSTFYDLYMDALSHKTSIVAYDAFQSVGDEYFATVRNASTPRPEEAVLAHLLEVADMLTTDPVHRAARYGLEAAVLDIWAQVHNCSVASLIFGGAQKDDKVSFYTVAMNDDLEEIKRQTKHGLLLTPYIKIKLDSDMDQAALVLQVVEEETRVHVDKSALKEKRTWTIDANSSWSVDTTRRFLTTLFPRYKDNLYMLEQPFPANLRALSAEEMAEWKKVKADCTTIGCQIFADESCSVPGDITMLAEVCHGVNIKLEKSGGIREALKMVKLARREKLLVWIGIMISSSLGSNVPAQLLHAADLGGDCDGHLLTMEETDKFIGGFKMDRATGIVEFPDVVGYGVTKKSEKK